MKSFNILALDENFQIVGIVSYTSLQWSRKFHESGLFSMSVPLGQYKSEWKYIYTPERSEIGEITQINYVSNNGFNQMYVSGYFLEEELNRMVVYPYSRYSEPPEGYYVEDGMPTSIYHNALANWEQKSGSANVIAHDYFNTFKSISFRNFYADNVNGAEYDKTFALDIQDGTSEAGSYNQTTDTRNGEQLGEKIYSILKPSGASYRIRFDFENAIKYFDVIIGKDRTEDNGTNNPVIFSTKYGNIINPNILVSDTDTKDAVIQGGEATKKGASLGEITNPNYTTVVVMANCNSDSRGRFIYKGLSCSFEDYQTDKGERGEYTDYKRACTPYATDELKDRAKIINVDFNALEGSYEYMVDFDLGDLVSIEVPEIEFSADARLIGCYETIENGVWNLSLEFGTPILKNK